jgi:hypothetical protein
LFSFESRYHQPQLTSAQIFRFFFPKENLLGWELKVLTCKWGKEEEECWSNFLNYFKIRVLFFNFLLGEICYLKLWSFWTKTTNQYPSQKKVNGKINFKFYKNVFKMWKRQFVFICLILLLSRHPLRQFFDVYFEK